MRHHILIVEDDRTTRMRLSAYLRELGYRVSEAEDAEAMEHILAYDPPELLLVDINLDGKDGLTITREQRAKSKVGIILLTSRADQIDKIVGLEMGADDYVVILPFLAGRIRRIHAAIFSFMAGVMPPMPMFGRSLLYVHSHCVARS